MSIAYRKRKKAIRDYKRANPDRLDSFGHVRSRDFAYLQANWEREITRPPIGTLQDFMDRSKNNE